MQAVPFVLDPQQIAPLLGEQSAFEVHVTIGGVTPLLDPELLPKPPLDPLETPLELPLVVPPELPPEPPLDPPPEPPVEPLVEPPLLDPELPPESPKSDTTEPPQLHTETAATANTRLTACAKCIAKALATQVLPPAPATPIADLGISTRTQAEAGQRASFVVLAVLAAGGGARPAGTGASPPGADARPLGRDAPPAGRDAPPPVFDGCAGVFVDGKSCRFEVIPRNRSFSSWKRFISR
jgi:hypothetical protein